LGSGLKFCFELLVKKRKEKKGKKKRQKKEKEKKNERKRRKKKKIPYLLNIPCCKYYVYVLVHVIVIKPL
jgi:hypothetical protein